MNSAERYNSLLQGRGESSNLFLALAIAVFGILALFTQNKIQGLSFAWFVLTFFYAGVFAAIVMAFKNWMWHLVNLERYEDSSISVEKDDLDPGKNYSWFIRTFVIADFSKLEEKDLVNIMTGILVAIIVTGALLYTIAAFHCGIGDPLNPACSFPEASP